MGKHKEITIFEIGACEGEDTIKYSRLFPEGMIYAFEPLPVNIKLIKDNFLKYGVKNASYFNKALSSENGLSEFYVSTGKPENVTDSNWNYGNKSSSLLAPEKHLETANFIQFNEKIVVETITIKTFCEASNIKVIDFIHMDVQGAELMVLKGAEDYISSIKVIWLEVSKIDLYKNQPLVDDVEKFMKQNNFVLVKNDLTGIQGDQMYISRNFYTPVKIFWFSKLIKIRSTLIRVILKLKRSK